MIRVIRPLALVLLGALQLQAQVAPGAPSEVSGLLSVTWSDPADFRGKSEVRTFVFDRATLRTVEVRIDSSLAAPHGGVLGMAGKVVTLRLAGGKRVSAVGSVRAQAALVSGPAPAPAPANLSNPVSNPSAFSGTRKYVILGCRYSDDATAPWPISQAVSMWMTDPASVRGFWQEVSNGVLDVIAEGRDFAALPAPKSSYVAGDGSANLDQIATDCIAAHNATVDFTQFDGVAFQMSDDLGCCAVAGSRFLNPEDTGFKEYAAVWIPGNITAPKMILGTYIHEIGHNFGLLHPATADEAPVSSNWSVMSNGFAFTENDARFGPQILAAQKEQLGWIAPARRFIATAPVSTITLERNALPGSNANYLVAMIPVGASERFYMVELRKAVSASFDRAIPLEGVVIHDWYAPFTKPWGSTVVDADGDGDSHDDGAVWTAGETFLDAPNNISVTIDAIGATSATITIRNGAGAALELSSFGVKRSVVAGSAAVMDSVAIRLDGPYGNSVSWAAERLGDKLRMRGTWLEITNPAGRGSAQLRLRHDPTGLGVGVYVDSIRISSPELAKRLTLFDTLEVTAPTALFAGFSVRSRSDSGTAPLGIGQDSSFLQVTGTGAATASFAISKRRSYHTIVVNGQFRTTGTGPSAIGWVRSASEVAALAPGTYVDTITATFTGTNVTATMLDSLIVLPAVEFTEALRRGKRVTAGEGAVPVLDSLFVGLAGRHGVSGAWRVESEGPGGAPKANFFMEPVRNFNRDQVDPMIWRGVGSGWFRYLRGNRLLTPGTYVDTLHILGPFAGLGSSSGRQYVIDTLEVVAGTRTIAVVPAFRKDTIVAGMSSTADSVRVVITGSGSGTLEYQATARGTLAVPNFMGGLSRGRNVAANALVWQRNVAGRTPGTYVDTIDVATVEASPVTTFVVDTVVILPALALQLPRARVTSVFTGAAAASDSLDLSLLGPSGGSTGWTAANVKPWNTMTTAAGTGTGKARWTRNVSGLAVGVHVDTITVTASGLPAQRFIDTMRVRPGGALSLSATSRSASRGAGQLPIADSATVTITGDNPFVTWTAAKRKDWTTLTTGHGTGTSKLRWTRTPGSLAQGTYVDTISIVASDGLNGATIIDTFVVVAPTTLVASIASRRTQVPAAGAPVADSADVTIAGPGAESVTWTATRRQSWTTLTTGAGTGSGKLRWTRDPGSLPATRVDTITITASDGVVGATIIDSLMVVIPTFIVPSSTSRSGSAAAGSAPVPDSVSFSLNGPPVVGTTWTATKKKPWTTLTTAEGTLASKLRWKRSAADLAPGTYVDTISITATNDVFGGAVIDTLIVTAPTVFAAAGLTPDSSGGVVGMDVTATLSLDLTAVAKSLGIYAATVTWDAGFLQLDSVRAVAGGFAAPNATPGSGTVSLSALDAAGKTGSVALARLHFHIVADVPAGGVETSISAAFSAAASIASQETNLLPAITTSTAKVVHLAGALRGDLNLDGKITQADALALVRALTGSAPVGTRATPNGDANCDGKVQALDAQIILRKTRGQAVESFCVGTIKPASQGPPPPAPPPPGF